MMRFHKNLQKRLQAKKMASGGKSWIGQAFSLNDIGLELQPEDFLGIYNLYIYIHVHIIIYIYIGLINLYISIYIYI